MRTGKLLLAGNWLSALALFFSGCAPTAATIPTAQTTTAAKPALSGVPSPTPKAAAGEPGYGGILPIRAYLEPPGFDLHQQQLVATRAVAIPAYDTLLWHNPLKNDEIGPVLAERYEISKDGLEYTFHLNKGVRFHDSSPLTVEDVRYSFERLRNPPRGVLSPRKALLASTDKIETPDANTVKFITKYPDASFIVGLALSNHVIYPRKVVEEKGDMKKAVMGTGPFKFVKYESGVVVEYTKNKDYFRKDRPYLDGLTFYIITDPATGFAAFRTGRVLLTSHASGGLNPVQAEITERELKGKARPLQYVGMSNTYVLINVSRKPLDDVRVRRALHLAVDRPKYIKAAFGGEGIMATFFLPEPKGKWELPNSEILKMPGYRPDKAVDIEEANKLLGEAGYDKGLSLTMSARTIHSRAAEVLREQYKAAGIDLKLEILETAGWQDRKTRQAYELLFDSWGVDADDPTLWLQNILADASLRDGQLDEWAQEQARILDFEKRKELVRKIQMRLFEVLPIVPSLKGGIWTMGIWDNVRNFPAPIGSTNSFKHVETWLAK
ncbi:MAG: ABC transporter substrate-binding protein [Chloroflexi bacterium]|nr:ABC transporter substrate-binding protein [Chloroflexota bacterium]